MERFETVLKDGPWTPEEDEKFIRFVRKHGRANWRDVPKLAGLERSWTSCRSRWMRSLRYSVKEATIERNEKTILYPLFSDDLSEIPSYLQGITGDEIEYLWNTRRKKLTIMNTRPKKRTTIMNALPKRKLIQRRIDPVHHRKFSQGRIDNNDIKNYNSFFDWNGFLSTPCIQGDSQGNRTNVKRSKVGEGATPFFQGMETDLKDGPWTPEEDKKFIHFVRKHGCANWRDVPKLAGLERSWTSCRSRWMKFLRYSVKGETTERHEKPILYAVNHRKFSQGRIYNNEIKNFNNFAEEKGFSPPLIQGDSQGSRTNVKTSKVGKGATPFSQETEETTPHSAVEGSNSSTFHPSSYQVPLQTTDVTSLESAQALAHENAELELGHLQKSYLESNLTIEGKSFYSSAKNHLPFDGPREEGLKEINSLNLHGDREEVLKEIDCLNLWMSKELGDIKESNMQSSSRVFWEIGERENEVHNPGMMAQACLDSHMLSPHLCESQLYSIIDFSPNWAYVSSKVEVLIRGRFLRRQQEAENCQWSCMFGAVEVPAEIVAYGCGVLRCHTLSQKVGRVPFYVTCSNRLACSEVREFEYRANLIQDAVATDDYGDFTSESLCMRFRELLCLSSVNTPNCDPSNLITDISQLKHKVSSLLKEESDSQDTSEEKFSSEEIKAKLLQKQLKEKLQAWLLQRAAEGGNGPSVLDQRGQGVLHFAAALGYDWAIEPAIVAGVNINFPDANGWTALHWAVYYGRECTVALLMSLGAAPGAVSDPTPKYPSGQTPADLASSIGHKGIARYLVESDFNSHLSAINLNKQDSDIAEIHGAKVVQTGYQQPSTPISDDGLSLKDSSAAVCNTTQAHVHIPQVFLVPCLTEEQLQESLLSPVSSHTHDLGHYDEPVHAAAIRIQNQFRNWKARKDFLIIRQQNVKIQGILDYTNEFANYKVFKSKEALIQFTREAGRKYGFVIVIKRSDSGNGDQKARITFCCERGGKYRSTTKIKENNKEKQLRNTVTKKCDCPFTLQGYKVDSNDNWKLKVVCGKHNHHPTIKPLEGRSHAGRLSKEQTEVVVNLYKNKVSPKEILATLKAKGASNDITIKHIYNVLQRHKVKEKAESSNNSLK